MKNYTCQNIQMELDLIDRSKKNIQRILQNETEEVFDPFIPNQLFRKSTGIGRHIFERLLSEEKIRTTKRGRTIFVHHEDIQRYLNGEIQ